MNEGCLRSAAKLDAGASWAQRIGSYTYVIPLVRQLGFDPELVLSRVGLQPDALDDAEEYIPFATSVALLDTAAKITGCDHFGLLVGRMSHVADLGIVGKLVRTARDVGEALEMVTAHQHLNSGGGLVFMMRRAGMVDLGYAVFDPAAGPAGQLYDAVLGFALNVMRELCGPGWAPTEVFLPHAKPLSHALFRTVFKANVRFDAETCAIRFPETWLSQPLDGADAEHARVTRAACYRMLEQRPVVERVYRALRLVMLHGDSSGDAVAQALSMHRRTLNRRLHGAGLTFQQVLDNVRFAVARELLEGSRLSLDDV